MFSGTRKRAQIVFDAKNSRNARFFALLEIACFYLSTATLVALLGQIVAAKVFGWTPSDFWDAALQVASAGAVGFLTNWLAIEMLFKPYDRKRWLFFWPQGLVPRNKAEIGEKAGEKIETELLDPEEIAKRLSASVSKLLQEDKTKKEISDAVLRFVREREDSVVEYVVPLVETSVIRLIKQHATKDKIRDFWERELAPRLRSEETRNLIAERVVVGLRRYSPTLTDNLKRWLRDYVRRYAENNLLGLGGDFIADGLIAFIDWNMARKMIDDKLGEPETQATIREILLEYVDDFQRWTNSPEADQKLETFVKEFRERLETVVRNYVQTEIPNAIRSLLVSPKLWNWLDVEFLPQIKPRVERAVRDKTPDVLRNLNFREIVATSIKNQDVREFHQMVNDVAAEHLGAIQVLGYALGVIVGALQVWAQ